MAATGRIATAARNASGSLGFIPYRKDATNFDVTSAATPIADYQQGVGGVPDDFQQTLDKFKYPLQNNPN
jgi:hypothetical protein